MSFDVALELRLGDKRIATRFCEASHALALVGPSGVGKTSIVNAIAGLLRPQSGHIVIGGTTFFDSAKRIDLSPRQRRCGYVFQDGRLFPHMRVRANLTYGARLAKANDNSNANANPPMSFDDLVDLLDLAPLLDRYPQTLSGGEARRVAIGRALLAAPQVLLLDEPLVSLDSERRELVFAMIARLKASLSIPILLVSHDRDEIARLADRVVQIKP